MLSKIIMQGGCCTLRGAADDKIRNFRRFHNGFTLILNIYIVDIMKIVKNIIFKLLCKQVIIYGYVLVYHRLIREFFFHIPSAIFSHLVGELFIK